jgi:hypothetical protein
MNEQNEIEELLDDSLETLADKKKFAKTMNTIIKDCAKKNNVDPKVIKAVKNYRHYKGVNWANNNPLEKDKDKKEKDKVAPIFIKLLEVVENLRAIGDKEFLEPYINAIAEKGIRIDIDFEDTDKDVGEIMEVIESASKLQTNVDTLVEELKEEKSITAEELNFTPKSSFVGILGILDKIKNGKNVDDTIQNNFTTITMLNNAYTYLSVENEKQKENEND